MAVPTCRNLKDTRQVLTQWLFRQMPEADSVEIRELNAAEGGASSETLFADVAVSQSGQVTDYRWVFRVEATRLQVYQDPSVKKQFETMAALSRHTAVPVPATHWYEGDPGVLGAPFFVMDRIEGRIPSLNYHAEGWLSDMAPRDREQLWLDAIRKLALVHDTDVSAVDFLHRTDLGATGLDQEIACWSHYFEWSGASRLPVLVRGHRWLVDHAPAHRPTGLAWGDARICNMIFDGTHCAAVIDWETVSLGGAEEDLGWWIVSDDSSSEMVGIKRLPGIGDREATIAAWEEFSGRKARDMDWQEVFATWRYAMISERAIQLYAENGTPIPGISSGDGNPYVVSLKRLLAAGS